MIQKTAKLYIHILRTWLYDTLELPITHKS